MHHAKFEIDRSNLTCLHSPKELTVTDLIIEKLCFYKALNFICLGWCDTGYLAQVLELDSFWLHFRN